MSAGEVPRGRQESERMPRGQGRLQADGTKHLGQRHMASGEDRQDLQGLIGNELIHGTDRPRIQIT